MCGNDQARQKLISHFNIFLSCIVLGYHCEIVQYSTVAACRNGIFSAIFLLHIIMSMYIMLG